MSRRFRDSLSLLLVNCVARRFAEGKSPMSRRALTRATRLPGALVKQLLDELVSVGVLAITHNESGTEVLYLPAIDIHRLTVSMVIAKLDRHGSELASDNWIIRNPEWQRLRNLRYEQKDDLIAEVKLD
jgi:membrane protein